MKLYSYPLILGVLLIASQQTSRASTLNIHTIPGAKKFDYPIMIDPVHASSELTQRAQIRTFELTENGFKIVDSGRQYSTNGGTINIEFGDYRSADGRHDRIGLMHTASVLTGTSNTYVSDFYQAGEVIESFTFKKELPIKAYSGLEPGSNWFVFEGRDNRIGGPYQFLQEFIWNDRGVTSVVDAGDRFTFGQTYYIDSTESETYTFRGHKVDIPEPQQFALLCAVLPVAVLLMQRQPRKLK